jgi:hypothetical protein
LKEVLGLPTNKAVAEALGLTASNLGERKNRAALPVEQIEQLCRQRAIRLEWVFDGMPPVYEGGRLPAQEKVGTYRRPLAPPLNSDLMTACMEAAEVALEEAGVKLPADRRARLVGAIYEFSLASGRVNRDAIPALVRLAGG